MKFNTSLNKESDYSNLIKNIVNYNNTSKGDIFTELPIDVYFYVEKELDNINTELEKLIKNVDINLFSNINDRIKKLLQLIQSKSTEYFVKNKFKYYDEYLSSIEQYITKNYDKKEQEEEDEDVTSLANTQDDEEEYEDDISYNEDEIIDNFTTKKDLAEMSYERVLNTDDLSDLKQLKSYRNRLIKKLKDVESLNKIQQVILKRKIDISYVIEEYFNYIINLCKEYNIEKAFKLNDEMPYDVMKYLRYKVKASDSENTKYTHDNGIIYFWIFKDAIVFKTI